MKSPKQTSLVHTTNGRFATRRQKKQAEENTGKKIYNILQLRVHPSIIALREKILSEHKNTKYEVLKARDFGKLHQVYGYFEVFHLENFKGKYFRLTFFFHADLATSL